MPAGTAGVVGVVAGAAGIGSSRSATEGTESLEGALWALAVGCKVAIRPKLRRVEPAQVASRGCKATDLGIKFQFLTR
jgi:hypothetical protein